MKVSELKILVIGSSTIYRELLAGCNERSQQSVTWRPDYVFPTVHGDLKRGIRSTKSLDGRHIQLMNALKPVICIPQNQAQHPGKRLVEAFGDYQILFWNCQTFAKVFLRVICTPPVEASHWTSTYVV